MFQGIQAVGLPLVNEFAQTREIEDRVMAPLAHQHGGLREDPLRGHAERAGRRARLPHGAVLPQQQRAPAREPGAAGGRDRGGLPVGRGPRTGHRDRMEPASGPAHLLPDRHPDHLPRLHLLPVGVPAPDPVAADRDPGQPARLRERRVARGHHAQPAAHGLAGEPGRAHRHRGRAHVARDAGVPQAGRSADSSSGGTGTGGG